MNYKCTPSAYNKIKLLFIIGPQGTLYPDILAKKLNEITVEMDENWKVFALGGYHISSINLPCPFELHTVPILASSKSFIMRVLYLIFCIFRGAKLVKEKNIQVIMCFGGHVHHGLVAYIISRLTNRRCIVRVSADFLLPLHFLMKDSGNVVFKSEIFLNMIGLIYRRMEIFLFRHFDWIVTHGPMDYEKIKKVTDKITFIPLWIDLEKFRPLDEEFVKKFKKKLTDDKDARILLFVGRLHPEKDVKTLLKAFKMVVDLNGKSNILLVLIGTGTSNYMEEYKNTTVQLKIADKTRFVGYIPHDELIKYYNIADLYILPSLREEWSNTVMEAMACKVPVIVTKVGGNPYLVIEGETGFLVPPKNPRSLAEKILFVLENTSLAKKISQNAFVEMNKYSKDKIGKIHKSVIINVIKGE